MSVNEKLTAIADEIRSYTGGTNLLTLDDMRAEISRVDQEGYHEGYDVGHNDGYIEGYIDGYSEGNGEATAAFWEAFTASGTRAFYEYAFRQTTFEYIRPQYKITPSGCRSLSMFHGCSNLKKIDKAYFDLSGVTAGTAASTAGHYNTFVDCGSLEEIEDIGLPAGGYYYTFAQCANLHTLEMFRVNADCKFNNAFTNCENLQNITVEDGSEIGQNGLNFQWSPLTTDSMKSIITHLKDLTGTSNAKAFTIKFSSSCWDALDAEGNTAPHGGTWKEYVQDVLSWNT